MAIHVYSVCYNEEALLPYFLKHYETFADKIVVFDGESTDRSRDILAAHSLVTLVTSAERLSHDKGMYNESTLMEIRNGAYKASKGSADWVVVVDVDEFVYHSEILEVLKRYQEQGITLPLISGFDMVSSSPPCGDGQIYDEIRTGFQNKMYSKHAIFNPEIDINFEPGCHRASPKGPVYENKETEIKLLHYRFLGPDHFADKYLLRQERISPQSRSMQWGTHLGIPGYPREEPLYPATRETLKERYVEIVSFMDLEDIFSGEKTRRLKLSIPLSIHNRTELFRRALETYMWQTLPPENWEIILIDDLSTEDVSEAYRHLIGRINIRHVYFDHTLHPLFKARNPSWRPGMRTDWFHTPALTTNLGCHLARARFVGLFHPEVMHAPENFMKAVELLIRNRCYIFGKVWLGSKDVNSWLSENPSWPNRGWESMMALSGATVCRAFSETELYWYCSFVEKSAVEKIRGVDFEYMKGTCYEDCDFKERVNRAGFPDLLDTSIQGLHQDHSEEKEPHRVRGFRWRKASERNNTLYRTRLNFSGFPSDVNVGFDWTSRECITKIVEYKVGRKEQVSE